MPDVLAFPAVVAPETLGLPFAAHPLEPLDGIGVLLARMRTLGVLLGIRHAVPVRISR